MPDLRSFHASMHDEIISLHTRVRSLLEEQWGEDGRYREVVIRSILRRHLPETLSVGTGFVLFKDGQSSQIDILVVRKDAPVIFREGDFYIVTSDAVEAIIEVKIGLGSTDPQHKPPMGSLRKAAVKLSENVALIRKEQKQIVETGGEDLARNVWCGLIAVEKRNVNDAALLKALAYAAKQDPDGVINVASFGPNLLARYTENPEKIQTDPEIILTEQRWHSYDFNRLPDDERKELAPSYFVGNCVDACSRSINALNAFAYYSIGETTPDGRYGKERVRTYWIGLESRRLTPFS